LRAVVRIQFTGGHSGGTVPIHVIHRVSGSRSTAAIMDLHRLVFTHMDLHRLVFTHFTGDPHSQVPQVLHFLSDGETGPVFEIP